MDVSYRLIPETNVPGMQGDVKRAVAWFKRNADRYGIDPHHIVLGGGSGGSHLALLAVYAPYHPRFTPEDVRDQDLSVRGIVGYYLADDYTPDPQSAEKRDRLERTVGGPLTDLLARWSGKPIAVDDTGNWDPTLLVGGRPDERPELIRQISPIVHVGADTPPTLQLVGEHDVYLSKRARELALHQQLQAAGVPSVYVQYPRTDHAFDLFLPRYSPGAQSAMYEVDRFLALMAAPVDWKVKRLARHIAPAK